MGICPVTISLSHCIYFFFFLFSFPFFCFLNCCICDKPNKLNLTNLDTVPHACTTHAHREPANDGPSFERRKEPGFLFTIWYYKFSPSKYQKLVKTKIKPKEELKPTTRCRKVLLSGVHTNTLRYCFQKDSVRGAFSKSCVFGHRFHYIRVDDSRIRNTNVAFENTYVLSGS